MKKKIPIILLNFTGVYELEAFASNKNIIHVDCRDMKGVDCYCDEEGSEELHRRLAPFPAKAVHFIDSGDFHYLRNIGCQEFMNLSRSLFSTIIRICSNRNGRVLCHVVVG